MRCCSDRGEEDCLYSMLEGRVFSNTGIELNVSSWTVCTLMVVLARYIAPRYRWLRFAQPTLDTDRETSEKQGQTRLLP